MILLQEDPITKSDISILIVRAINMEENRSQPRQCKTHKEIKW